LAAIENHLIELLPRNDRRRLLAVCEPIHLVLADVIHEPGAATRHVYFPVHGFISLVAQIDEHPGLEVGMVGREGMLGSNLALGVEIAPLRALVQGAGAAWRITAADFRRELVRSAPLQRVLDRYIQVSLSQLAASAACLRFHQVGPRLSRWLLMSQDRAHADSFHVTHEILAYMLGVRRVGITKAAASLQRQSLIRYRRGEITILDRKGLEARSCGCYFAANELYDRILGAGGRRH
jgi:CRP-like cAMP-binding protein